MLSEKTLKKLEGIKKRSISGKQVNDLFKIITTSQDLWNQAYVNIYPNKGAMTQGVDEVTMDGHSEERVNDLIIRLKTNRYFPKPVKRVYIPKANGKMRPLGVPTGHEKLVQEVWRILLECIYEPIFQDHSHGFRRERSCHTALESLRTWNGIKWFVEFDIAACFDKIDQKILLKLLKQRIDDHKFIKIIERMLQAGAMDNWKYEHTFSGTPQGSGVSPILANIYLHELDEYLDKLSRDFNQGSRRKSNPEHVRIRQRKSRMGKQINKAKEEGTPYPHLVQEIKELTALQLATPQGIPHDPNFKRLRYLRYADDFIVGIIGSKNEASVVLEKIKTFLQEKLRLQLSEEKTAIRHHQTGVRFLGYDLRTAHNRHAVRKIRLQGIHTKTKSSDSQIFKLAPDDKIAKYIRKKGWGTLENMKGIHRSYLIELSDTEILLTYNAEMRGIANYYSLASNYWNQMGKVFYLGQTSLVKTLAYKHNRSVAATYSWLKQGRKIPGISTNGREYSIVRPQDIKRKTKTAHSKVDCFPITQVYSSRTELEQRMQAHKCEYCGREKGYFEVHHVKKLADISSGKETWQKLMMARRRKTLILCAGHAKACHNLLHSGKLPDFRFMSEGESRVLLT